MSKDTTPENSPQEEPSIGDLLRTEREKKEISKSHLAEIIKVRESVIDALENEEWDKLPARVFVKGFIRSYTISIGYDTTKALRLFDKSVPTTRDEDTPVPLTARRKKSRGMYYVIPILIILVIAVYLFTVREKVEKDIEPIQPVSETPISPAETGPEESTQQAESVKKSIFEEVEETKKQNNKTSNIQRTAPPEPEKEGTVKEETSKTSEAKVEKEETPEEIAVETVTVEKIIANEPDILEEETDTVSDEQSVATLTLYATVKMETYVRMIVDDNPPKEYIFQPGRNPQWEAMRGFEVMVGNAAGIEFEFNGEKIETIGDIGKVKILRFPKDFKTNWKEEE